MKPVIFHSSALGLLSALLVGIAFSGEGPSPLPALPPEPRTLQLDAGKGLRPADRPDGENHRGLIDDASALRRAVARVHAALGQAAAAPAHDATHPAPPGTADASHPAHEPSGAPRSAARFGEALLVQRFADGTATVTSFIDRQPAEEVCRELSALLGRGFDDAQSPTGRRTVSLHLKDVAWDEAFDRLLGQVGLGWREEGSGKSATIVVYDTALRSSDPRRTESLANRALRRAVADADSPSAAEAMSLLAAHEQLAGRHLEAMRLYSELSDRFGATNDPAVRAWVMRAIRGIGDCMAALGQHQDARGVYLTYISRADKDDRELPAVHLAAAEAGRRHGIARQDPIALDEAIDTLHLLLERFADEPFAAGQVHLARLMLGDLLFEARRWKEAATQLHLVIKNGGGKANDRLTFWLAECAFQLGQGDEARPGFERLARAWKAGHADPQLDAKIYATAAYRIGQCHLATKEPRYIHALFAFLRARQDFPRSTLDAELLIGIARCSAELQRDDETVNSLWELLKSDAVSDARPGNLQLSQLLGELEGRLSEYAGPVRAKVLFYIAQADWRRALRDRRERAAAAQDALNHYERVVAENPPSELLHAARLGLARAAFLAGLDERGVSTLRDLMKDPSLSARDRDLAANLLGSHLRDKGQLREAIRAFRGEVEP